MPGDGSPIDGERLWRRLMELAEIGATPAGGVNRQALTDGEIEAWRLLLRWAEDAGLEPSTDPAGNLFLMLRGSDPAAAPILVGSHLDSQPTGGRFDGAAGVLAALEVVTAMAERGREPLRDVIVVAWMNEEGCRFAPGMMGSEAFAGVRRLDEIRAVRDADGISVGEALDRLHGAFPHLPHRELGFRPACFLELHIEQGPVLEAEACPVGVVTGIQGKKTFRVSVAGREGHAGTVAMSERRDAVLAFARLAQALYAEVAALDPAIMFTVGRVQVSPNAPSVIASNVTFSIDLRHPDNALLEEAGRKIEAICRKGPDADAVTLVPLVDAPSNAFDADLQARIARAASALGVRTMPILSAAGHDARHLARVCPTAMVFIPCRDGISHAENEWVEPEHLVAGTRVLARVIEDLAFQEPRQEAILADRD